MELLALACAPAEVDGRATSTQDDLLGKAIEVGAELSAAVPSSSLFAGDVPKFLGPTANPCRIVPDIPAGGEYSLRSSLTNGEPRRFARRAYVSTLPADIGGMGFIEAHQAECLLSALIRTHIPMAARSGGGVLGPPVQRAHCRVCSNGNLFEDLRITADLRNPTVPSTMPMGIVVAKLSVRRRDGTPFTVGCRLPRPISATAGSMRSTLATT
jgi:hypothetical protein